MQGRAGKTSSAPASILEGARELEWALQDSNLGPIGYEPTALTAELRARALRSKI